MLRFKRPKSFRSVWSAVRGSAVASGRISALPAALGKHCTGRHYINVGHNFPKPAAWSAFRDFTSAVMIHDLIPITHPQYCRPDVRARFLDRVSSAIASAEVILTPSAYTADMVAQNYPDAARKLRISPLGIEAPPEGQLPSDKRHFLCLGTIEPRKNHSLLLDVWAQATDLPPLVIAGRRGWQNEGVFGRLDAKPDNVQEVGAVPQDVLEALWAQAYALVMPSFVEGFGLPVAEALARGVPVIASDIPSHREVAGGRAVFLPPDDPKAWTLAIKRAVSGQAIPPENNFSTWRDHFNIVDEILR